MIDGERLQTVFHGQSYRFTFPIYSNRLLANMIEKLRKVAHIIRPSTSTILIPRTIRLCSDVSKIIASCRTPGMTAIATPSLAVAVMCLVADANGNDSIFQWRIGFSLHSQIK